MSRREYWELFTHKSNIDILGKDLHPSWSTANKNYSDHTEINKDALSLIKNRDRCLDFGIGLGRNYDYLTSIFSSVDGYDTYPMVEKLNSIKKATKGIFFSDPNILVSKKYDLVYEAVVFQHMDLPELQNILKIISFISDKLYITSRSYNDQDRDFRNNSGGTNVLDFILNTKLFTVDWIDSDLERARTLLTEEHYRVLLSSKR